MNRLMAHVDMYANAYGGRYSSQVENVSGRGGEFNYATLLRESTTSFSTVVNQSSRPIWIKPEDNTKKPFQLGVGKSTSRRIDAVTSPGRYGEVFKVVTGLDVLFGVVVNDRGAYIGSGFLLSPLPQELNILLGGGWLSESPDSGWDAILEKSK